MRRKTRPVLDLSPCGEHSFRLWPVRHRRTKSKRASMIHGRQHVSRSRTRCRGTIILNCAPTRLLFRAFQCVLAPHHAHDSEDDLERALVNESVKRVRAHKLLKVRLRLEASDVPSS